MIPRHISTLLGPHLLTAVLALSLSSATAGAESAQPNPDAPVLKTLVMPLEARRGLDPGLAAAMTDVLLTALAADRQRSVLSRTDLAQVLDHETDKQLLGCDSTSCYADIAAAMDVDSLVTGAIDLLGDSYLISLTELDARTIKPVARVQGDCPIDETTLLRTVKALVQELQAQSQGKVTLFGEVEIRSLPSGAGVRIDNRDHGVTPVATELPIGTHRVSLSSPGESLPAVFDLTVARKQKTTAEVQLAVRAEPSEAQVQDHERALFWHPMLLIAKLVGGVVLCPIGCLGTSIFGVGLSQIPAMQTNDTGLKVQSAIITGSITGVFALAALSGAGLCGWGIADIFIGVEDPDTGPPQHLITITAPDAAPQQLTLPATEPPLAMAF